MTTIQVWRDHQGEIIRLRACGHSGYAEEGSDIVCAAVSVLMTTCANALESVAGCETDVQVNERCGLMDLRFHPDTDGKARIVTETVLQGLRDVSEAYPEQVQIK